MKPKTRAPRTDSLSPERKRMRLSSPTYDDQVEGLSQDHISAFDALLSQHTYENRHTNTLQLNSSDQPCASSDDEDNPFAFKVGECSKSSVDPPQDIPAGPLFMKASLMGHAPAVEWGDSNDQGDDAPPDMDCSSWFESSVPTALVGFKTAATALPSGGKVGGISVASRSSEGLLIPSATAFFKAKAKMKLWNDEDETISASQQDGANEPTPSLPSRAVSPPRPTFTSASKLFSTPVPDTPVPAARATAPPPKFLVGKQPKPFKSPLITNSPLRPSTITNISSPLRSADQPSVPQSPLVSQRPLGFTPARTRPRFVTPFKSGIGPGVSNSTALKTPTPLRYNVVNPIYPPSTVRKQHEDKPASKVSYFCS